MHFYHVLSLAFESVNPVCALNAQCCSLLEVLPTRTSQMDLLTSSGWACKAGPATPCQRRSLLEVLRVVRV